MKITRRNPVEFIKYVLLFIKWNPDSPVGNADGYCPPSLSAGNRQFGFLLRVFHCIIYQVTDDVAEMRGGRAWQVPVSSQLWELWMPYPIRYLIDIVKLLMSRCTVTHS